MKKKTILIYPEGEKLHTLYSSIIELLSKKYNLIYHPKETNEEGIISRLKRINTIRYFYHRFIRYFLNLYTFKKRKILFEGDFDLIFSSNQIPPGNKDYIINLEFITALSGYNYYGLDLEKIKAEFSKKRCKAIICWNKWAYNTLKNSIDCSSFKHKIKIIPFAIKSDNIKKRPHKGINLLFVSSINNPYDFERKGGLIALEAFSLLSKKISNVKFFVRANVPQKILKNYESNTNIIFLKDYLEKQKMKELFLNSDILLEPLPGINLVLECANFEIPVVCFNGLWFQEIIVNGKTGFLVDSQKLWGDMKKDMKKFLRDFDINYFKLNNLNFAKEISSDFAEKTSLLINKPYLINKFGKELKKALKPQGKYNLIKRNKKLLKLIEESLQ